MWNVEPQHRIVILSCLQLPLWFHTSSLPADAFLPLLPTASHRTVYHLALLLSSPSFTICSSGYLSVYSNHRHFFWQRLSANPRSFNRLSRLLRLFFACVITLTGTLRTNIGESKEPSFTSVVTFIGSESILAVLPGRCSCHTYSWRGSGSS